MSTKLDRVLSFDDFVKKGSEKTTNKVAPKKVEPVQISKTNIQPKVALTKPVTPKTTHLVENTIAPPKIIQPVKRISKKELVDILNNVFSNREPDFTVGDITWDFLSAFNNKTRLISSKKDLSDPDFYTKISDELNALTGILTELTEEYGIDPYIQKEEFIDDTAKTISDINKSNIVDSAEDDKVEEFHIDDEVPSPTQGLYESTILVEGSYKVKTTFSVPSNLIDEYKAKVHEDTGDDVNKAYTDTELAEQMVEYILQKYLVIDNIPTSLAVGENTIDNEQNKADEEATHQTKDDEGNINVEEKEEETVNGLLGLTETKIEFLD
jgi:hypothetical protein